MSVLFPTECELSCHPNCATDLSETPCVISIRNDNDGGEDDDDDYISFITVSRFG